MDIQSWYSLNFESRLMGRYVTLNHILPLLDAYRNEFEISISGKSELGKEIPLIKIGSGEKVVLAWSQMHGNESTTTKTLFDFLKFLSQKTNFQREIKRFLSEYTLFVVPMLNPDGSSLYTRENANLVDLNRDAQNLTQSESIILHTIFKKVQPQLCLNLHGQRTIYGLVDALPATVSFLSPSADKTRSITLSRKIAMETIVRLDRLLQKYIPGQIGRYDDSFNLNCVGDTFQNEGVPTILIEAGHYQGDYQREKTREFLFYVFIELFEIEGKKNHLNTFESYFLIPENKVNYKDYILRNIKFNNSDSVSSIGIQFKEVLNDNSIVFEPYIDALGDLHEFHGHEERDGGGARVLVNSQQNVCVGDKISTIVNEKNISLIYFPQ